MKKNAHIALTLWITYIAIGVVLLVSAGLVWILEWNSISRLLLPAERTAIITGYYCSLPMILLSLWEVLRILRKIKGGEVFVTENVKSLTILRSCCLGIFAVCLVAGCFFFPLLLVVAIMGFLSLMMQVVKQVMAQAVAIKEENELTI